MTSKELIKSFNLYGKITEQHAKDIEEILDSFIKQAKQEKRNEILKWAKNYIERDMKIYGTDKHGIALEDLENFLNNKKTRKE